MTTSQKELARHALGLPNTNKQSYRNRFVTSRGSKDCEEWQSMVVRGDAAKRDGLGGDVMFCLTRQGATLALDEGEQLDPDDFPE